VLEVVVDAVLFASDEPDFEEVDDDESLEAVELVDVDELESLFSLEGADRFLSEFRLSLR
jgi:hypothetical protein